MSSTKIIHNILFVVESILCAYMLFDLIYKKNKFKNGKIKKINNIKYMAMIILIVTIYIAYGFMRNVI